jgi:hypothetical protein
MKPIYGALSLAAAACALSGCSSDYWVDFKYVSDADSRVIVSRDRVEIPVGFAVAVEAYPIEDGERQGYDLDMRPGRPGIVGVDRGIEDLRWVFYGEDIGETSIELFFDGEYVADLPASIVDAD